LNRQKRQKVIEVIALQNRKRRDRMQVEYLMQNRER
jgi:NH3-dependent NAD+ synthetase